MHISIEVVHGIIAFCCAWTAVTVPVAFVLFGRRIGR